MAEGVDQTIVDDAERAPETEHGTVLAGRYVIEAMLGSGGMGAVYRAKDLELDEPVALKMLNRGLDDPNVAERFRREVKLARRVTHRNVARTFDIGEHQGSRFLTMELVLGTSLGTYARASRPTLARATEIISELCLGLAAAHEAGVIHRDLKPENVLVADDGRIVITDFGIACSFAKDPQEARGILLGTPAYMAPEQIEAAPDVDARADIYALGEILYELITGERAWQGETIYKIAAAKLDSPPPDPKTKCAELPDALALIITKCMARDRNARFSTAAEVKLAIENALATDDGPALTVRTPPIAAAPEPRARRSVAVMPFKNGGPADDEYIAAGVTEDIIDVLSGSRDLRVRHGATRGDAGSEDASAVGRALGVDVVVFGSVRRAGGGLRVSVRLVSVADGFQLWTRRYDVSLARVFSIGDEAGAAVAEAVTLEWSAAPRPSAADTDAVDLYLRARHAYNHLTLESMLRSIELFGDALSRSPDDPKILAGLAMALTRQLFYDESKGAADRALEIARRACALAPERVETRIAVATILLGVGNVVEAAAEAALARKAAPENVDVLEVTSRLLYETNHVAEAIAVARQVMALDPSRKVLAYDIGRMHALLGQWDDAGLAFDELPDADTANPYWVARWRLLMWSRDAATAQALLPIASATTFFLRDSTLHFLRLIAGLEDAAPVYADIGTRSNAERAFRRRALMAQLAAETSAFIGDEARLVTALEDADRVALFDIAWLDRCPLFEPYRNGASFVAVRSRIAERAAHVFGALQS